MKDVNYIQNFFKEGWYIKNIKISFILSLLLFHLSGPLGGQTNILPLNQIKPGMKGYGLTVLRGIKIEKFDVEILSVLRGRTPKSGMIIARIQHEVIDKAGVIAGMSGSPIYIEGKLVGALAYSWSFSKDSIAGITPVEDMLKILSLPTNNQSYNFEPDETYYASHNDNTQSLQCIKTPLIFQGVSENVINVFKDDLLKMNFLPMTGSGGKWDYEVPEEFEPGSAVSVNIITGDMNLSGLGTVTYVDKNKILIFGHPMFFSGYSDMPLAHAYIHTILPSMIQSFKMGTSTKIAGRVYQDQSSGVAGLLNEEARMIPVKVNVDYFDNKDIFNYNIIRSYHFFPAFLMLSISQSMSVLGGEYDKNTMQFSFKINFNNDKTILLEDTLASVSSLDSLQSSMMSLLDPIRSLLVNKFEDVQINNVDVEIKLNNDIKIAEIVSASAQKKVYRPGEKVDIRVKLRPYHGEVFYKNIQIDLPENIPDRRFVLFISSDQERQYIDYMLSPKKYRAQSIEHLITLYDSLSRSTELSIWAIIRDKSIIARDSVMEHLPSSYYSILQNSLETGMEKSIMQIKNKIVLDYIVSGSAILYIEVKKEFYE